jgi:zinc protease
MGYVLAPYKMGDDFHAFQLMNYIYGGGGFSSRLMLRIRNDLGLTYGIYSTLESMQQDGAYRIGVDTKPEATGQVVGEVIDVMEAFIAEGPTDEELQEAKAYLIGSYPRRFETPSNIATQFQSKLMFGYDDPAKEIAEYRAKINEVSRDDVMAMAKKYLMPEKLRIVVVGPGEAVKDQVAEYGDVTVKTVNEI